MQNPIILPLNYNNLNQPKKLLDIVGEKIGMIQIGSELFLSCGKESFKLGKEYKLPIFLDLKIYDTPSAVERTLNWLLDDLPPIKLYISYNILGGLEMEDKITSIVSNYNEIVLVKSIFLPSITGTDLWSKQFRNSKIGTTVKKMIGSFEYIKEATTSNQWGYARHRQVYKIVKGTFLLPAYILKPIVEFKRESEIIAEGIDFGDLTLKDHKTPKSLKFTLDNGADWIIIERAITEAKEPFWAAEDILNKINKIRKNYGA